MLQLDDVTDREVIPTVPDEQQTSVTESHDSMPLPRRLLGRRALLAGAGVAAVASAAGAAELATHVGARNYQEIEQRKSQQQFEAGVAAGRQALARELLALEGPSLDAAIRVADLTELGAVRIIKPLADLATASAGDVLGACEAAVRRARGALSLLHLDIGALDSLAALLATWRGGLTRAQLGDMAVTDVTLADSYLRLLKLKLDQEAAPTPTSSTPAC